MSETGEEKGVNLTFDEGKKQAPPHSKRTKYLVIDLLIFLCLIFLVLSFFFFKMNTVITLFYIFRFLSVLACSILLIFLIYGIKKETGVLKLSQAVPYFALPLIVFLLVIMTPPENEVDNILTSTCIENLKNFHSRFIDYSKQNNHRYPEADKWCDSFNLKKNEFELMCPLNFKLDEPCSYAMNPHCEPNSPGDVVLLFESKGGWNLFGGPELSNDKAHSERQWFFGFKCYGCNVLFNDGHVEFVEGKKLRNLKWK